MGLAMGLWLGLALGLWLGLLLCKRRLGPGFGSARPRWWLRRGWAPRSPGS